MIIVNIVRFFRNWRVYSTAVCEFSAMGGPEGHDLALLPVVVRDAPRYGARRARPQG